MWVYSSCLVIAKLNCTCKYYNNPFCKHIVIIFFVMRLCFIHIGSFENHFFPCSIVLKGEISAQIPNKREKMQHFFLFALRKKCVSCISPLVAFIVAALSFIQREIADKNHVFNQNSMRISEKKNCALLKKTKHYVLTELRSSLKLRI